MTAPLTNTAVRLVLEAAAHFVGVEPALLKAIAHVESSWNPKAKSPVGARGLCQLMPITAKELGVTDAFDAMQNALGGALYIRSQLKRFGNVRLALAAYNWGPRNVQVKHLDNGGALPLQVQTYADRVLERRQLERMQDPAPCAIGTRCDMCGQIVTRPPERPRSKPPEEVG